MQVDGLQGDDEIMSPNQKGPSSWANSGRGQQARQQARGSSKPGNAGGPLAKSRLLAAARAEHEAGGSPQSNPSGFFATFFRRGALLLPDARGCQGQLQCMSQPPVAVLCVMVTS
jgi:hypothetical protein